MRAAKGLHILCVAIPLAMAMALAHAYTPPQLHLRPESSPDYVVAVGAAGTSSGLEWKEVQGVIDSTGRSYVGYLATFSPSFFSVVPPTPESCSTWQYTSVTAQQNGCVYATNGGFFTFDQSAESKCVGNLISDGVQIQLDGMDMVNFGVTSDLELVAGFIDETVLSEYVFSQLISGVGFLVRDGKSYVSSSKDLNPTSTFTTEKAPRTSVGFFSNGTMLLFEVDGEEDIDEGVDLYEFAELLVSVGAEVAINLDGGGSSVSTYEGSVISTPTCNDTPEVCERSVTSITCVH